MQPANPQENTNQNEHNKNKDRTSRRNQILVKNSMIYLNWQTPST